MGTPDFAVPALHAVASTQHLLGVVTNPDRPRGRGRKLACCAVKQAAEQYDRPVWQPAKINRSEMIAQLQDLAPDVIVVVAYGHILSPRLLAVARLGCINVHASLLPAYRGAAPIQWAVIRGEEKTGVTTMQMEKGLDSGPIYLQKEMPIKRDDTAGSLSPRLAALGADALRETLTGVQNGTLQPTPQPEQNVSWAPMLTKQDGRVDWTASAAQVANLIRGTDPWPGAFTFFAAKRLKLFGATMTAGHGRPGEILGREDDALIVACGTGAVAVSELQLAGRRRMSARALLAGLSLPVGSQLGPAASPQTERKA